MRVRVPSPRLLAFERMLTKCTIGNSGLLRLDDSNVSKKRKVRAASPIPSGETFGFRLYREAQPKKQRGESSNRKQGTERSGSMVSG